MSEKKAHKILVVDDNQFYLQIIESELKKLGCEVFTAQDGEKALSIADKELPDLILIDLILPKVDGFEVIEKLSKNKDLNDSKIIVFSQLSQQEDIDKVKKLGADAYMIKKDFSVKELVDKIESMIK